MAGIRLDYASTPSTVPLAGQAGLTLTMTNSGDAPVRVEQVTLTLPLGDAASDLIASRSVIVPGGAWCSNGSEWVLSAVDNQVLVLPVAQTGYVVLAKGDVVYVSLAQLQMNGQGAGTATAIAVSETLDGQLANTGSIALTKSKTALQVTAFAPQAYFANLGATVSIEWAVEGATSTTLDAKVLKSYPMPPGGAPKCQGDGIGGGTPSGKYACALQGPTLFTLTATAGEATLTSTFVVASGLPAPAPYTATRLLVPVDVSAMVITTHIQQNKTFASVAPNYQLLKRYDPMVPQPFQPGDPAVGVTLHWVLPGALKHGRVQSDTGELSFPNVPNRWLVTRLAPDAKAPSGRGVTAWLVSSDYLGDDGTNSFAPPTVRQLLPTMIGAQVPLDAWQGEQAGYPLFLTALGDGQASFVAYTAGIGNVFSFQDPLSDATLPPNSRLAYAVTGWYSDPAQDLLAPATTPAAWEALVQQLGWQVTQPAAPEYPPQLACQGFVYDVFWSGADYLKLCTDRGEPLMGVPVTAQTKSDACPGQTLTVAQYAIGNTPLDAFASLIEYQLCNDPDHPAPDYDARTLLQAFFYDELIDYGTPAGEVRLDEKVRQTWFGASPGGTSWSAIPTEDPDPDSGPPRPKPEFDERGEPDLIDLNDKQRRLDDADAVQADLQRQLYQLWWKQQKGRSSLTYPPLPPSVLAAIDAEYARVKAQLEALKADAGTQGSIAWLRAQRDAAKKKASDDIIGDAGQFDLVEFSRPRSWQPNAPVLLVTGALGDTKHGPDTRFSDDGTLACRLSGQTLDALSVSYDAGAGKVTLKAGADPQCTGSGCAVVAYADLGLQYAGTDLDAAFLARHAPPEAAAFLLEACLLDTGNAAALLGIALKKMGQTPDDRAPLVAQFQQQQRALVPGGGTWDRYSLAPSATGTPFVPPSPVGVSPWQAPWSPLYLDWQVTWYPALDTTDDRLTQWEFDPDAGNGLHYRWKGGLLTGDGVQLSGRAILSGSASELLGTWLDRRLHQYPAIDNANLRDLANRIATWDVLAQSLSGFTEQLVQLQIGQHPLPTNDINLIGPGDEAIPVPGPTTLQSPPAFFPLRAGQMAVTGLQVVDDFGQVFDPIQASAGMPLIAGPELALDADGNPLPPDSPPQSLTRVAFPPRLAQDSRLDFRLISGEETAEEALDIRDDPVKSPVCGFLLRNLLDDSMAVYANDGTLEGNLYLSGTGIVQWEPNPSTSTTVGQAPAIANPYLLAIVKGVLAHPDNASAYGALLTELDLIVGKLDLSGASYNTSLSVLIGRPIAVVRARMELRYAGLPLYDQAWAQTGKRNTAGVESIRFPVRLGGLKMPHDGLYGYYVDTPTSIAKGYDRFHVVYEDPALLAGKSDYITPGDIELSFGDAGPTHVTMLMEPSSYAYAITGLFPDGNVALAGSLTDPAIQNMDIVFRTGPTLSPPDQVSIIKPSSVYGDWDWVQHTGVRIATLPVSPVSVKATFTNDSPKLRDGWLKLSNAMGKPDAPASRPRNPRK